MPTVDLIVKAVGDDPLSVPYEIRRVRVQAGEIVGIRKAAALANALAGYGIVPLVSRAFRIVRVTDLAEGEAEMLLGADAALPGDEENNIAPRRRLWRVRLNEVPDSVRQSLIPRRLPDIDHQFFLDHPTARQRLLEKSPGLAELPPERRRPTPWDVAVNRSQIAPLFLQKAVEERDADQTPLEGPEVPQDIDTEDGIR